jgi:endonuclease YncB( thermonuclease family)
MAMRRARLDPRGDVGATPGSMCLGPLLMAQSLLQTISLLAIVFAAPVLASPIEPGAIEVVDGDTIRAGGRTVRLVGFDTPEMGSRARCESERMLAAAASTRLRQLIAGGGLDLEWVACSCAPGTEGTLACNHGRACATLKARGRDVGAILISEGLARPFVCGPQSCPAQQAWCGPAERRSGRI